MNEPAREGAPPAPIGAPAAARTSSEVRPLEARVGPLRAALRIVADTARYRLEKREMGNLVTSMTLALALRLAPGDLAYRFGFGALLNVWVYLVNDCFDVELDLRAGDRVRERTRFLAAHRRVGVATSIALGAVLLALGFLHDTGLALSFAFTALVIVAYSGWLKRRPIVDLASMAAWGFSMAMVGFPLDSPAGPRFAILLALLCAVTEALQVIRDERSDAASGIRTTAVVLGPAATALVARALVLASAAYAVLFLHRFIGAALLVALPVSLRPERVDRSWDLLRVVFGLTWLALLGAWYATGRLSPLLPSG